MSSILSARGANLISLGGERAWLQRTKGDLCISYEWLDTGKQDPEACMCLFPTTLKRDAGAYAIPQGSAHEYATSDGNPTSHLMTAALKALVTLGYLHTDKAAWQRIVDAILEGLPDLIRMPSDQPGQLDIKRAAIGIEARAKVAGQTIHEKVL